MFSSRGLWSSSCLTNKLLTGICLPYLWPGYQWQTALWREGGNNPDSRDVGGGVGWGGGSGPNPGELWL